MYAITLKNAPLPNTFTTVQILIRTCRAHDAYLDLFVLSTSVAHYSGRAGQAGNIAELPDWQQRCGRSTRR
jgi:hypothetical protein